MSLVIPPLHGLSFGGSGVATVPPVHPAAFVLGINQSGSENPYPTWPSLDQLAWWANRNVKAFRYPVIWDSIQPTLSGQLDTTSTSFSGPNASGVSYLAAVSQVIANAASLGMTVLIDVHASGRWKGNVVGQGVASVADFVDLWRRLSAYFQADPHYAAIRGYDLMNEWHDMDLAGGDSTSYSRALIASCNQGAINAIRANGDTKCIHVEGDHYSGAWNWVPNNGAWALTLNDPANNLIFHVHCYLDSDSSGTNFAYAVEAAKPGYSPPGLQVNPMIGPQRMAAVTAWAAANGKRLALGECGWGSDAPRKYDNPLGLDDSASWNVAATNMIQHCVDHQIEFYGWGGGPGFGRSYGYCPEPLDLASGGKNFTATGFNAPQIVVYDHFSGFAGPQPTVYELELPGVADAGDFNTSLYALPLGQPMGGSGSSPTATYFPFRLKYSGVLSGSVTYTPFVTLADGVTPAPGVTITPASITVNGGTNPIGTFTLTATQAQTMLVGCTNDRGWTNPPLQAVSSINDQYRQLGDVAAPIFALRREYSPYVGPALRLIRPSDGAQQDFSFDNVGNLPRQAIQDWASARQGIAIAALYDQSNQGHHAFHSGGRGFATLSLASNGYPEIVFPGGAQAGFNFPFDVKFAQAISLMARASAATIDQFVRQDYYTGPFNWNLQGFTVTDPRNSATGFNQTVNGSTAGGYHSYAATFRANAVNGQKVLLDGMVQAQANTTGAYTELHTNGDFGNDNDTQFGWFVYYGPSRYEGGVQSLRAWHAERSATELQAFIAADNAYYGTALPDSLSAVAPSITGLGPRNIYSTTVQPFGGIGVADDNGGSPTDSATITLSGAAATLSGSGLSGTGPYSIAAASAGALTNTLRGLSLTTSAATGSTVTLALRVASSAGTSSTGSVTVTVAAYGVEAAFTPPTGTFVPRNHKGANVSGGENGYTILPRFWELDYIAAKGFGLFRMPLNDHVLLDQGLQPLRTDNNNLADVKSIIDYAFTKNLYVIIDVHTYGYFTAPGVGNFGLVGVTGNGVDDAFADYWSRVASRFKNYPNVIFGLMNEPHDQSPADWKKGCLPAIRAIRAAGATQLILIPGSGQYDGAHSWIGDGNAAAWAGFNAPGWTDGNGDPANNFAFEMHQYLDDNNSGTSPFAAAGKGSTVLGDATGWARTNGFKCFLGEFGFAPATWRPSTSNAMNYDNAQPAVATGGMVEGGALLDYMSANSDVWMGWSVWEMGAFQQPPRDGGYAYCVEPLQGDGGLVQPPVDQPQMALLTAHL